MQRRATSKNRSISEGSCRDRARRRSRVFRGLQSTDRSMCVSAFPGKATWISLCSVSLQEFRAHGRSHPRAAEIYAELERLSDELIKHGHQFDASWITRPIDVDETEIIVLCGHSEKLAIAWNFVANPTTQRIQVTKNLRICGDCRKFSSELTPPRRYHCLFVVDAATKLIARIRRCEIIVRDANRIHHFDTEGRCSCGDHF